MKRDDSQDTDMWPGYPATDRFKEEDGRLIPLPPSAKLRMGQAVTGAILTGNQWLTLAGEGQEVVGKLIATDTDPRAWDALIEQQTATIQKLEGQLRTAYDNLVWLEIQKKRGRTR